MDSSTRNPDISTAQRASAVPSGASPLLSAQDVLSAKHGVSFVMLALSAGAVNAGALLVCERFVTHMTGIVTRVGLDVSRWVLMAEYLAVFLSFVAGAMLSVVAIQARAARSKPPLYALPLFVVAAVLTCVAIVGHYEIFGAVGGHREKPADFALLCILAGAMGLMNAAVASSTTYSVRTTHMTGPATDLGVHLATMIFARGDERKTAARLAALRGAKIAAFALGAAVMLPLVARGGYLAFAVPAVLVLVAAVRSFLRASVAVPTSPKTSSELVAANQRSVSW